MHPTINRLYANEIIADRHRRAADARLARRAKASRPTGDGSAPGLTRSVRLRLGSALASRS